MTLDRILATRSDDRLLLQDLQPAQTVRAEPTENRHVEGQIDTVRTYVYDGIEIEVYDVAEGRAFIQRVEVTSPPYETSGGIAVGQTRSDIEAVYGSPVREDGPVAIYEMGEGPTPTTVEVRYSSDGSGLPRAESITWRPYVD